MLIKRRALLGGLAAASIFRPGTLLANGPRRKRVGVIGGGIMGASAAAQLALAGADVVLFEKEEPAAGATGASVAWINPVVNDAHYMKLRVESIDAWKQDDLLYGMNVIWGGSVNWVNGAHKIHELKEDFDVIAASYEKPRLLTGPQIAESFPGVIPGDAVSFAFQTSLDGHVDPVFATRRYLTVAEWHGAKVVYPCEVTAIKLVKGRLASVTTTKGDYDVDCLVSATGTDTTRIMSLVGHDFAMAHKPGLVVHTNPLPFQTNKVFEADGYIEFKQYYDGRVLTRFGSPPDLPQHAGIRARQISYPSEALKEHHGRLLISETAKLFPLVRDANPARILLGFRPYPLDNRPVIGEVPGIGGFYMMVTHSGITLAPILGRYIAQEIMAGSIPAILAPYSPTRYISA